MCPVIASSQRSAAAAAAAATVERPYVNNRGAAAGDGTGAWRPGLLCSPHFDMVSENFRRTTPSLPVRSHVCRIALIVAFIAFKSKWLLFHVQTFSPPGRGKGHRRYCLCRTDPVLGATAGAIGPADWRIYAGLV
jgi:hypothetical protein